MIMESLHTIWWLQGHLGPDGQPAYFGQAGAPVDFGQAGQPAY